MIYYGFWIIDHLPPQKFHPSAYIHVFTIHKKSSSKRPTTSNACFLSIIHEPDNQSTAAVLLWESSGLIYSVEYLFPGNIRVNNEYRLKRPSCKTENCDTKIEWTRHRSIFYPLQYPHLDAGLKTLQVAWRHCFLTGYRDLRVKNIFPYYGGYQYLQPY